MKTVEQLKTELAKAEAFEALCGKLDMSNFPDDVTLSEHAYKADVLATWEVESLPDAILAYERANPIQSVRYKDSCLSFIPEAALSDKERALWDEGRADIRPVSYVYRVDNWHKEFQFYTENNGVRVMCRVRVMHDPNTALKFYATYDRDGNARRVTDELVNTSGYFTNVDRFWSSEDTPRPRVLWT